MGLTKSAVKKLDVFLCEACQKEPQETVESGDENVRTVSPSVRGGLLLVPSVR